LRTLSIVGLRTISESFDGKQRIKRIHCVPVPTTRELVERLHTEMPDWIPILRAAVTVAERVEPYGGQFAGSWVLQEWARTFKPDVAWKPGLRTLAAYELIEKVGDSTRGGRRAYYRLKDRAGVDEALKELGA
jgi:hypothetical protein